MRVLYLNPCGQMGGAETSLLELLASVRAAEPNWEVWLVLGEDGPLTAKARQLGVRVMVAPFPPALAGLGDMRSGRFSAAWSMLKASGGTALYARRLAAILRLVRPEIIHTNGFKMHLLGVWCRPRQTPVLWHIHDYVRARPLMSRLLRRFAKTCAAAIVNSNSVAADLRALAPNLKVVPIYNAIDLERFSPTGRCLDLDAISGLAPAAPGTIRVGLVATFARWKGHSIFLQALSRLSLEVPIRGYVVGGPIYQTSGSQLSMIELQQETERLGLAGRVGLTGLLDDTAAAMRSLDIIVHASTQPEPFGMVIIEGMACGKAVIACDSGGAAELFVDGADALGYPAGNADALAQRILALACDQELRRRLGWAARVKAEQLYRGERLAKELVVLYRSVTGHGGETVGEPADVKTGPGVESSAAHAR